MGEITPVDVEGLSGDALTLAAVRQGEQLHRCLEQHIAVTRLAELDATEKRLAVASDVLSVKTDVQSVKADVQALTTSLSVKTAAGEVQPAKVKAHLSPSTLGTIILALVASSGFWTALQALIAHWPAHH